MQKKLLHVYSMFLEILTKNKLVNLTGFNDEI